MLVAGTPCSAEVGHLARWRGRELRRSAGKLLSTSTEIINLKAIHVILVFTR